METYIVKVNGKTYEVEVEKQGEQAVQSIKPVKTRRHRRWHRDRRLPAVHRAKFGKLYRQRARR